MRPRQVSRENAIRGILFYSEKMRDIMMISFDVTQVEMSGSPPL